MSPKKGPRGLKFSFLEINLISHFNMLLITQAFHLNIPFKMGNDFFSKVRSTQLFTLQFEGLDVAKLPGNYRPSKTATSVNAIGLKHVYIY